MKSEELTVNEIANILKANPAFFKLQPYCQGYKFITYFMELEEMLKGLVALRIKMLLQNKALSTSQEFVVTGNTNWWQMLVNVTRAQVKEERA